MKRILVTIAVSLYLSTSAGATVHMHYCMGKLADWGFGQNKSKTCGGCGMETKEAQDLGCCKDEYKFIKNDADQKLTEFSLQVMEVMGSDLLPAHTEIPSFHKSFVTEEYPFSNAPPRSSSVAVYILKRSFLI